VQIEDYLLTPVVCRETGGGVNIIHKGTLKFAWASATRPFGSFRLSAVSGETPSVVDSAARPAESREF
jgi:hypothetical protein